METLWLVPFFGHRSPQTKRGLDLRAKPVLFGLWVVLADYGTCFAV